MAIQGAPRRLRGQNPNAPQIPTFSPNDFGGQLGNMQIGNMGGLMGSQPRQPTYLGTPPPQDDNQLLPVRNTALPNPSLLAMVIALGGPWAMGWHMAWQLRGLNINDPAKCLQLFRVNRDTGMIPLLFFAVALFV